MLVIFDVKKLMVDARRFKPVPSPPSPHQRCRLDVPLSQHLERLDRHAALALTLLEQLQRAPAPLP